MIVSGLKWWAPEIVVPTESRDFHDYPFLWFARVCVPLGTRPPFNAYELRFRQALAASISELGGLKWLTSASLKPTKAFLNLMSYHYEETGA